MISRKGQAMNLVKVTLKTLRWDQSSVDVSEAISLDNETLAMVAGGQGLGGYSGTDVYGGPNGFGGWGTVATPEGVVTWHATSSPDGFTFWTGRGYTSLGLGGTDGLGSYGQLPGGIAY